MRYFCIFLSVFLYTNSSLARPIAYPSGLAVMQHNDYISNNIHLNYTLSRKNTVGLMSEYQREDQFLLNTIQYTRVLKRWNQDHSQGNLYFVSGLGGAEIKNNFEAGGLAGIEADWEDRRFYLFYRNTYMKVETMKKEFREMGRIGVAPYIGGYKDLNTWLILQVDHTPQLEDNIVVTPLVRFFKGTYLAEFGVSSEKTILFNFMTIF